MQRHLNDGEDKLSNNDSGTTEQPHAKKRNCLPNLAPYAKINSQWNTNLNVKPKTIKLLKRKHKKKFCDLGLGKDFLA